MMKNIYSKPSVYLSHHLLKYKVPMIAGMLCVAVATAAQLTTPWILRFAIDYIQYGDKAPANVLSGMIASVLRNHNAYSHLLMLLSFGALIILFTAVQGLFRFYMRSLMIGVSRKIEYEIRNDFFRHLLTLEPQFYQKHKTGDLMALATNDLDAVRSLLGPGIMHLVTTVLVAVSALVLMMNLNTQLTLFALAPLPLVALTVKRLLAKIHKTFAKIQEQFAKVTAKAQENISGIRVIKTYVQEEAEAETFRELNRHLLEKNVSLAKVRAILWGGIEFLLGFSIIIVIWRGGFLVISGKMTIGSLVAFLAYLGMLAWPMIALGWVMNMWEQGLASLKRMLSIWLTEPQIKDTDETNHSIKNLKGSIEFRNVTFSYDENKRKIIPNIDLRIPAGQTLAIVGPTGSGKSSLVNLILRLYEVKEGELLIDGHNIKSIPLRVLRKNIGYVPQETFLFSDSLELNIGFGEDDPQPIEIEKAAESSQIKLDFDQFEDGLKTMVGERGITLSGGQKQRTALSRAIIRKPKILILDDALSAVDTYTEEEILKRLREIMKERTSIIVSHRISSVKDADNIIVLDDGEIVEQGTHDRLIQQQGLYFKMHQRQLLEKSLEEL
jgi:ATP-binding cassette subfamily B multidrug efflux pump